jgi:hypothetical protein
MTPCLGAELTHLFIPLVAGCVDISILDASQHKYCSSIDGKMQKKNIDSQESVWLRNKMKERISAETRTHQRKLIRMYLFSSVRMRKGNKKDTFSANLKVINHAYGLRKNVEKILQRNVIHSESGNNEKMHFL